MERAPGARSIGEEFVETSILVTEFQRCENTGFHFHAAPFGTRSLEGEGTQNPNMCTPFWEKYPLGTPHISLTTMRVSENSSDFDSGRRPESKSDEFSDTRIVVSEIISILVEIVRR